MTNRMNRRGGGRPGLAGGLALLTLAGLAAGPAMAQVRTVNPDRAVVASVTRAVQLQPGDAELFASLGNVTERFINRPGVAEFTGVMMVQPKSQRGAGKALNRAEARVAPLVRERFDDVGTILVDLPQGVDENTFAEMLLATGDYEWVEPDYRVFVLEQANDPQFNSSWQHQRLQSVQAWGVEVGSSNQIVAIVDTGMDTNHPDLAGALVPGFNALSNVAEADGGTVEDQQGHGTFVAGCAAAMGNNNTGVVGVGWNFRIMPIKVSATTGTASLSDLQQGARWAADNGADVVNVSFSGIQSSSWEITGKRVRDAGALLFHAAGNDNALMGAPEYDHVIVVGSTTSSDGRSGFSNRGPLVTLTAPGSSVRSTRVGGGYGNGSGTSYASPIAAGVGALILAANENLSPGDVQDVLYMSLDDLGAPGKDDNFGRGRVNSFKAVTNAIAFEPRLEAPVGDSFGAAGPSADVWSTVSNAPAADPGFGSASDGVATRVTPSSTLQSRASRFFDPVFNSQPLVVSLTASPRSVETGEDLRLEFKDEAGDWQPLITLEGDNRERDGFVRYEAFLPEAAIFSGVEFRIAADGSDETDAWFIDGFSVEEIDIDDGRPIPALRSFEVPLEIDSTIASVDSARIVTDALGATGGTRAMEIDAGGNVTFLPLDTLDPDVLFNPVDVRLDWRTEGVPAGAELVIEYEIQRDNWVEVASVTADGTDSAFASFDAQLTFIGFAVDADFRIRAEDGAGKWYVDEVFFGRDAYPAPQDISTPVCNVADTAEPFGVLDLSDVDTFISAFSTGGGAADVAAPFGVLDLADIDAFIVAFQAGCP